MKHHTVKIVYYSGTGGTKLIADSFARQLADADMSVDVRPIPMRREDQTSAWDLMIVLFPVYAFRAPEPVYQWVAGLKNGGDKAVAVISVSGGGEVWPNTACRQKVIKNLEALEYQVIYEEMAVMPSNIAIPTPPPVDRMLVDLVPDFVAGVLDDLKQGEGRRTTPGRSDRIMACLGSAEKYGAHFFGRRIRVLDSCTGCGICAGQCPSGNIGMRSGRPIFEGKCFLCMKCFYNCPTHSLSPGIGKFSVLKSGYDLEKLQSKPATEEMEKMGFGHLAVAQYGIPIIKDQLETTIPGPVWSGVRKYILETQAKTASRRGKE